MPIVSVKPETIALDIPGHSIYYISLGQARDIYTALGKIFAERVKAGKGLT